MVTLPNDQYNAESWFNGLIWPHLPITKGRGGRGRGCVVDTLDLDLLICKNIAQSKALFIGGQFVQFPCVLEAINMNLFISLFYIPTFWLLVSCICKFIIPVT